MTEQGSPDLKAAKEVADFLGTVHHEFHFTVQVNNRGFTLILISGFFVFLLVNNAFHFCRTELMLLKMLFTTSRRMMSQR